VIEKLKGRPRHTGNEGLMKKNKRGFEKKNKEKQKRMNQNHLWFPV
jgi:hypothetical protein